MQRIINLIPGLTEINAATPWDLPYLMIILKAVETNEDAHIKILNIQLTLKSNNKSFI